MKLIKAVVQPKANELSFRIQNLRIYCLSSFQQVKGHSSLKWAILYVLISVIISFNLERDDILIQFKGTVKVA